MRMIKFRVWDKGKMFYLEALNDKCNHILQIGSDGFWLNSYETGELITSTKLGGNIMQLTGLNDIKGQEVYEDDLLGYWDKDINKVDKLHLCRVSFSNGSFVADVSRYLNGKLFTDLKYYLEKYVVVGNVYENPQLLEGRTA